MNMRFLLVSFLSLLLLILPGCTKAEHPANNKQTNNEVKFQVVAEDTLPKELKRQLKDIKEKKHEEEYDSKEFIPFYTNNTNYVLLTTGLKRTGGYSINVEKVLVENNHVTIYAQDVQPADGAMVTQSLTVPTMVITIPGKDQISKENIEVVWTKTRAK